MLGKNLNNYNFKFTALGFVYGDGISQIKFHYIILFIVNQPVARMKNNRAGQINIINIPDNTDITIKNAQIIIVSSVNDPVANPENFFTNL